MKAILDNLTTLEQELAFFATLTEEQAIELYNVDYKAEAMEYILAWWN